MPLSVMQDIKVDYSLPLSEIGPLINTVSHETVEEEERYPVPDEVEIESRIAEQEMESEEHRECREDRTDIEANLPGLSWRSVGNLRR